jgi:CheY-like chemotaxis protein
VGVADGLKAWEIMQERRFSFDIVLTEVVMPSLSGIGLLTRVVSTEECRSIPVISKFTYQLKKVHIPSSLDIVDSTIWINFNG